MHRVAPATLGGPRGLAILAAEAGTTRGLLSGIAIGRCPGHPIGRSTLAEIPLTANGQRRNVRTAVLHGGGPRLRERPTHTRGLRLVTSVTVALDFTQRRAERGIARSLRAVTRR